MKKTLILLGALAGVAGAATKTTSVDFSNFATTLSGIQTQYAPTEFTLALTFASNNFGNTDSDYILTLASSGTTSWGLFSQAGSYVGTKLSTASDLTWTAPTSTSDDGTTRTWNVTADAISGLPSYWISYNTTGGHVGPGVNSTAVTVAVTETGSTVTLNLTNGTTSVISTNYAFSLGEIALGSHITGISNGTLTYKTPEPATATLSLLALAGLAARRRRR